jgi:hypothetical protein
MLRFILSWLGRILLITAGIGIWQLKDWGRKLAIILFIMNILTLPWKHALISFGYSYKYFHTHPELIELMVKNTTGIKINLALLSFVFLTSWDFLLNATLILFFTQKKIKEKFH